MLGLIVWVHCCLFIIQIHGQQLKDMVTDIIGMAGEILKINYFGFDSLTKFLK